MDHIHDVRQVRILTLTILQKITIQYSFMSYIITKFALLKIHNLYIYTQVYIVQYTITILHPTTIIHRFFWIHSQQNHLNNVETWNSSIFLYSLAFLGI